MNPPSELSRREQEVLNLLLDNLANKELAERLHISERTVKFHVSNILAKFGVRRRADLILLCYQRREDMIPSNTAPPGSSGVREQKPHFPECGNSVKRNVSKLIVSVRQVRMFGLLHNQLRFCFGNL